MSVVLYDGGFGHGNFVLPPPRVVTLGAERFWDQSATEWPLGTGTFEIVRTLGDHTAQRSLYAVLDAPLLSAPWLTLGSVITSISALVIGSGFSSLPTNAARLRLMTRDRGVLISQTDPSANTAALNTAHAITVDASAAPLVFADPTDPVLVEFDSPYAGSGWGTFKFVGMQIRLASSYVDPSNGERVYLV